MPIEIVVDSIDAVDESLRGAYVESDGKYALDPDKYAELKAAGLKKKNSELIGKEKQLKEALSKLEKFKDIDPEVFEEFIEARDRSHEQTGNRPDGKLDDAALRTLDKQVKKLQSKYEQDAAAWAEEKARMDAELKHYKLTVPLKEVALKAGVLPDDVDLALMETAKRFRLDDSGRIQVLDEDGDPTTDTPERFFKEIYREKRPKFYQATGAGGSGATPGSKGAPGAKVMKRTAFESLSAADQMKFVQAGGTLTD